MEILLKNKETLKQVAFDIYDFNNDSKISEIDLFKTFQAFQKTPVIFEDAFQQDLCVLTKEIKLKR